MEENMFKKILLVVEGGALDCAVTAVGTASVKEVRHLVYLKQKSGRTIAIKRSGLSAEDHKYLDACQGQP